jgi:ketosteroid isomerase-like protein
MADGAGEGAMEVLQRLVQAVNAHDLEGLVSCFSEGFCNETPAHPPRSFRGVEQVRRNWTQIFAGVPDIKAQVPRTALDGGTAWTEWELSGTRTDGADFLMRGVVIFGLSKAEITSARFYLEPVEESSGDVNAHAARVAGTVAAAAEETS